MRDRERERLGCAVADDDVLERHVLVRAGGDVLIRQRCQRRRRAVFVEGALEGEVLGTDMEGGVLERPLAIRRAVAVETAALQRPVVNT